MFFEDMSGRCMVCGVTACTRRRKGDDSTHKACVQGVNQYSNNMNLRVYITLAGMCVCLCVYVRACLCVP